MRKFVQDLKIGTKLLIASGISLALVVSIVAMQLNRNADVRRTIEVETVQQIISRNAIDLKASTRGMQLAIRDLRLSETPADIQKAKDYLDAREKSATGFIDEMLSLSKNKENYERIQKLRSDVIEYGSKGHLIIAVRSELIAITSKIANGSQASPETAQKIIQLNNETTRIAREVTLPLAAGLDPLTNKIIDFAKKRAEEESANVLAQMASSENIALFLGGITALLLIGTCVFSALTIARPMRALSGAMLELAEGRFDLVLPGLGRKDEIGQVAEAVDRFKVKAQERARLEAEAQRQQEIFAAEQRKNDMSRLADQFEAAVGEIIETVSSASSELEVSANSLTRTADLTRDLSTRVSSASEEASANVQSVASASEEMASSVNEISRQVQESARIAHEAVQQANKTNDRVNDLSKAANRIGDVVELINTVAGQTNLLALNATIEAARAGEAGRGFAVVASEVKILAEQTAKATEEIRQQIGGIQTATQDSVHAIGEISMTISRISEISATIAAAVEEQGAATQEVSRNVQQASQGSQEVASSITQVQRGAAETGSASSQVLAAAKSLSQDGRRLKSEVGKFLDSVRAA